MHVTPELEILHSKASNSGNWATNLPELLVLQPLLFPTQDRRMMPTFDNVHGRHPSLIWSATITTGTIAS